MNDYRDTGLQDCTAVIAAFGGIRPMAHKLGVPVSTVQGWKQRNAIPQNRVGDILAAADTHNIDLAAVIGASGPDEASPPPAADSPVISPARPQNGGSVRKQNDRGAFSVALIALIVAIAAGGWSVFGDRQSADFTDMSERLTALETAPKIGDTAGSRQQFADDLTELRAALDRIAQSQEEFTGPGEDIGQIIERLEAAETRLDQTQRNSALEARAAKAASAAAQGEIDKLRLQLTALGGNRPVAGQNAAAAVGLALAAGRLRRAIDNGDAYENVLATLRTLSEDDATTGAILDRLSKHAGTGVPARDALTRAFPGIARDVAAAANTADASGWTDRTLQRIRNTVSIRRIGADVPGDTPDAKVARAEAKLLDGDLEGAVAEVDGLTGAAASAAATWLDDARARYDAEVAVGELEALAIARLQTGSSGS
jgi:hypothetical protein